MNTKEIDVWSTARLKDFVKTIITSMFSTVLDYAEVAVDGKDRFTILRSKVLREGNDAIRAICSEIEKNYSVSFTGIREDVVKVERKVSRNNSGGK